MKEIFPDWRAQGVTACLHEHQGGFAFNRESVLGLAGKCREEGVEILTGVEVRALELAGDGTVGAVETSRGRLEVGEQLVVAPGPWARRFWSMLELPATIDVRTPGGEVVEDQPMWTYWNLQEGEIQVDPQMFATADGSAPPVVHLDTDAPLYTDEGELVTDELWGIYYKRDRHGVQGGASPLVVEGDVELDPYPSTTDVDAHFPDMWCAALSHAMSRFEGCRPRYKMARSGGVGAFTADNFPVFDYMRPNVYTILDSNHGYKMIGVGREVAKVSARRPLEPPAPVPVRALRHGRPPPGLELALPLVVGGVVEGEAAGEPRFRRRLQEQGDDDRERDDGRELRLVADAVGDEDPDQRGGNDARLPGPGEEDELLAGPAAPAVGKQAGEHRQRTGEEDERGQRDQRRERLVGRSCRTAGSRPG